MPREAPRLLPSAPAQMNTGSSFRETRDLLSGRETESSLAVVRLMSSSKHDLPRPRSTAAATGASLVAGSNLTELPCRLFSRLGGLARAMWARL